MKTLSQVVVCVALLGAFSAPVFADEHDHGTVASEKKTGRKKRQLICKECGKPEKQCECKGEEHGESDGHGHEKKK